MIVIHIRFNRRYQMRMRYSSKSASKSLCLPSSTASSHGVCPCAVRAPSLAPRLTST